MLNTNICVQYLTKPYSFIKPNIDFDLLIKLNSITSTLFIDSFILLDTDDSLPLVIYLQFNFKEIINVTEIQTKAL